MPDAAATTTGARRLAASGITVSFAGLHAIDGVDIHVETGEILGLIGPNGAGKTTMLNVLSGFQKPSEGSVALDGRDVTRWSPRRRARNGVGRTFQAVRVFPDLTVFENVEVGAIASGNFRRRSRARRRAFEIMELVGIHHLGPQKAGALPFGDERRVGIARALAGDPTFLLLDEPAAGLMEQETDELTGTIRRIRDGFGCGVVVIEHDMRLVMTLCDRVHVLDYGKTIAVGTPAEVQADPAVIEAYLGAEERE